jgi:hypothetical protein
MMKFIAAVFGLISLIVPHQARAASAALNLTPQAASLELTGRGSRTWILTAVKKHMGSSGSCTHGETYRFGAPDKLTISKCLGGKMIAESHKWRLIAGSPDLLLTIDAVQFRARLLSKGTGRQLLMRQAADVKTMQTTDMLLSLSQD